MIGIARNAQRLQIISGRLIRSMSTNMASTNGNNCPPLNSSMHSPDAAAIQPSSVVPHVPIPSRGVDYRNKIVLAPMVRSGELPSRLLALHYKADLVWGPETVDRSMIGTTLSTNPRNGCLEWSRRPNNSVPPPGQSLKDSIIYRIDPQRESDKLIFQIGTNDPSRAVSAAKLVAPYCAGIDVNAGCPKPFSTDGGMGAALLTTENGDLLARILTALVQEITPAFQIGISVKIRLLSTPEETSKLVHKLCKTGIIGLTIHCRTRPMRPRERAIREQLRMIGEICRSYGVACLMNGDVASRDEGVKLAAEYGVDGGMIATAAEANSSVFLPESEGGKRHWKEVVEQYMRFAIQVENKWGNTKFLLSQLMPGRDPSYMKVNQSKGYMDCINALGMHKDAQLYEEAKALDQLLGLDGSKFDRAAIKKANKAANRALCEANIAKKRAAEESQQQEVVKKERRTSPERAPEDTGKSQIQKAQIAADNAGFEGVGQGALQVAV